MTTKPSATCAPGRLLPGPDVAGHSVQRDESQHLFLIDQRIIACTPVEYRLLALLLSQIDRCVPYAQLIEQLQEEPPTSAALLKQAKSKVIHVMSDIRSKIWALGFDLVSVMNVGYILMSSGTAHLAHLEAQKRVDKKEEQWQNEVLS